MKEGSACDVRTAIDGQRERLMAGDAPRQRQCALWFNKRLSRPRRSQGGTPLGDIADQLAARRSAQDKRCRAPPAPLSRSAPGLTPRAVLQSLSSIQMMEVHLPTTDGRTLIMPRHTEPEAEQKMILQTLKLTLPPQPPPRIRGGKAELPVSVKQ